ncbi:hypothetical protein Xmau_02513 [Xenorhabdus mauleonii]|uniref:Uncharacterized protein n=1 Tax=Xenorhabdus mauleonii TaxID=351675 RepID=A0A1I3RJP4_9GAMM|nr:hypothetical protein [Xenorhabdus mauleonii]PHM39907.1 hypothetical protein Xmau_02513 [Xenorhabdus mauleonii]SFJ45959.1 hypothetical protein SAMN05421680_109148 [Xenorhabdus mauleonii]
MSDNSNDSVNYENVKIKKLYTHKLFQPEAKNNVEVSFEDLDEKPYSNFYLVHPDGEIEGGAVYATLLYAMLYKKRITVKTDGVVGKYNERYISGVVISND